MGGITPLSFFFFFFWYSLLILPSEVISLELLHSSVEVFSLSGVPLFVGTPFCIFLFIDYPTGWIRVIFNNPTESKLWITVVWSPNFKLCVCLNIFYLIIYVISSCSNSMCPKLHPTSLIHKTSNTDQNTKKIQVILLLPLKFYSFMCLSKEIRREMSIDIREIWWNSEKNSQRGISFIECDILNFHGKSPASKRKRCGQSSFKGILVLICARLYATDFFELEIPCTFLISGSD